LSNKFWKRVLRIAFSNYSKYKEVKKADQMTCKEAQDKEVTCERYI